jgi:hypothetical protein
MTGGFNPNIWDELKPIQEELLLIFHQIEWAQGYIRDRELR